MDADVVRESTIFSALSPRGYSRRERPSDTSDLRGSAAVESGTNPPGLLPPVHLRDASAILRSPQQLVSPNSLHMPKTPQSLMMAVPMTTNECWLVWKFLCDWVKTQLAMEVPAAIPGFGTFYVRVQPLGIRITLFEPDKHFLNKLGIHVDSEVPDPALVASVATVSNIDALTSTARGRAASVIGLKDVFAFSFVEMAACCGNAVDATRAQEWLAVVIHKVGNAMSQCGRVELNVGVGVIVCVDRVIQRHLLSRDSRPSPRLEYEIRTGESVVKRNLRAQASLQKPHPSKAKYSFLSGSTFSPSIQLNPVLDRSKDVPDFSFGPPNPRPPTSTAVVAAAENRSSPRSAQLRQRYQRSQSPLMIRINSNATAAPIVSTVEATQGNNRATEKVQMPPQLFDRLSRTLCVEPDQNVSYLVPSNRIGSNFTESAAFLMTQKVASQFGQLTQGSGGLVFAERPPLAKPSQQTRDSTQNLTSEQRYFQYVSDDTLIERCCLATLPAPLETRVVAAAVKYIVGSTSDQIERVMEVAHQEFVDNYYSSAKKAILNYLLMRPTSCARLEVPEGVPVHALLPSKWKWGSSEGHIGCIADLKLLVARRRGRPTNAKRMKKDSKRDSTRSDAVPNKTSRRKRVQSKLMSLLVLSNPQVRALRFMWHDLLTSISLVDLPIIDGFSDALEPMDILEFERTQLAFSAKMKTFVMENWYSNIELMFESAIRAETFSIHTSEAAVNFRLRHLFDTVAAVMSLQIRSLIMKSIQAYVTFFEMFGEINEESQGSGSDLPMQGRPAYSGLLTTLVLHDGQIQFRDPLVDIPSRLLNVLHNIPKLFCNLGRIETQFEEPLVLPNTSSPFLWNVASQEDDIVVATIRIRAIIEHNLSYLRKLQADYDIFALTHRYVNSVDCFQLEENSELETYRAEMERVQATAMKLAIENRHSQHLGLFSVDCRHVNIKLHSELAQWTIQLLQAFEQRTSRMNSELRQQYKEIAARLAKKPLDLYELVDAEAFVHSLKTSKLEELQERGNAIKQRLRFLLFERENMHIGTVAIDGLPDATLTGFQLSADLLSSTAKTVKWRGHIEKLLKEAESLLVNERARIEAMFIAKRSRFQAEIDEFEGEVRGFAKKGDLRHAATYVVQLAKMKDNMLIFRQAMETIVKEEQKLQWKPTDFSKLDDIAEEMAPYEQLWKTVREFREMNSRWLRGNVFELPGTDGLEILQQMLTVVANVSSVLLLNSAAAAITAETVRKQMTDFRENVRLIVAIQNPAMKDRHMNAVSGLIGLDFSSDEATTLLKLLENGAFEMVNEIVDISCNATQEQQIEQALNEMGEEWEATSFELVPSRHPFSSSAVLRPLVAIDDSNREAFNAVLEKTCADRVVAMMEDHLMRLQALSCMAHAGPFIEDIALWQTFAFDMGQVVEMLSLVEQLWRKLTPLFAAGIAESDSKESQLFASGAELYRSTHATIMLKPACTRFFQRTSSLRDPDDLSPVKALMSDLKQCSVILDTLRGAVRVGFQTKRSSFARFYFLSDDELVTALALARVPGDVALWKALSRCFPGIHSVQSNVGNEITALVSSAGEPFPLGSPIATADAPMPTWLAKLETSMTTILHASIRAACSDLPRKEFRKWCLIWPEQSLLAAIQHVWTLDSEQANQSLDLRKGWTELTDNLHQNIESVSKEIKVAAYPHAKTTLSNVLLLLGQLRDVSNDVLGEVGGVWVDESFESSREMRQSSQQSKPSRFQPSLTWIAQPRFYFADSVLNITMMNSAYLAYGLEYLGNGSAGLLVTPLTLRCFHAIAQAASTMVNGACLEGPAGAGKSTICHQLASLCGRLYVTYQCGNRKVSFDELVNFAKATASSGAWLCVDNFQLLDAISASMVTTLCAQVMTSLAARQAQCTLAGDRVRLRRGALFVLTLTPRQYCSNSPSDAHWDGGLLADARFFFRTVVVQTPDIERLAEFELQRGRFVHAALLAKLVVSVLAAFERGFERMFSAETARAHEGLGSRVTNLRLIKSVVKRATELNSSDREYRRRTRRSVLIRSEAEENEGVSATSTEEPLCNDATAEAVARHDEERMEHRNVYVALREHLGCLVPSSSLHMIDAIIRDFNSLALERELYMSKSNLRTARGSTMHSSTRFGGGQPRRSLEDDVESYVRTNESSWRRFGVEFGLKAVQLLQTMRHHRMIVLVGGMQTGKTSLYASLSRALTQISKKKTPDRSNVRAIRLDADAEATLVAPVRYVVVFPRALQLGQLLDLEDEDHSQSVLSKLLHEAKTCFKADKRTQTWLVFDGDLDALWSEQLLHTVEELQDDFPGYRKGLQVSSGKYLTIPEYARLVMETTTLTNASPSFITRVGTLYMNSGANRTAGWENAYAVWKSFRKAEFEGYAEFVFAILDSLMAETVSATLEFVDTQFQSCTCGGESVMRVQWTLGMLDSGLKQSWKKFVSLTSDKQRNTAVHGLFLQALVWGVGSTASALERQKFHAFLYDLILRGPNNEQSTLKRLILMFFPNGALAGSISSNLGGEKSNSSPAVASGKQTVYNYGFSLEFGSKWLPWTEYYNRWIQLLLGPTPGGQPNAKSSTLSGSLGSRLSHLFVPTATTAAAFCLSGQLLLSNYPVTLCGPSDCGKTVCGSAWQLLSCAMSKLPINAQVPVAASSSGQQESSRANTTNFSDATPDDMTAISKVYAGYYSGASSVLLHFEAALQRIRIERQENTKRESLARQVSGSSKVPNEPLTNLTPLAVQDLKRPTFVFVDDLQCFNPNRRMDSALELMRMLVEHQTIVDPATNLVTPCHNFVPFSTLRTPIQRSQTEAHDLDRLVRRCTPVALQPFSDSDLTSICESFTSSELVSCAPSQPSRTSSTPAGASVSAVSKETEQLHGMLVRASVKLYRALASSNDLAVLSNEATQNPVKLQYNYRVGQLFQIVKTICCDIRPALTLTEKPYLARLWCHESARILGDRILDSKESSAFHRRVIDVALTTFGVAEDSFFPPRFESSALQNPTLTQNWVANELFFSFVGDVPTGAVYQNGYHEVSDMGKLEHVIERSMMAMNQADSSTSSCPESTEVILCSYVVKHVLRVSRLLKLERKAVLLLAKRGGKLATITRLACHICKKASMMYHVPVRVASQTPFSRSHGGDEAAKSKWNAALRAAMLKAFRVRETSLAFIVKDMSVLPEAYPYQIIDRFLAGFNVPSEVISHEDLDEETLSTLREFAQREKSPPPITRADSRQSVSAHQQTSPALRSKTAILDYFFEYVRQKLQFVLVLTPGVLAENGPSVMWRFPNILRHSDINYAGEWPTDGLVTIAQKCLSHCPAAPDKQLQMQLAEAAVQVYETTGQFLKDGHVKTLGTVLEQRVDVDPGMLVDHLAMFCAHYHQLQHSVSVNVALFKTGLEFIDETARILEAEQKQADQLLPEVLEKTEVRRRMSGSLEREKIVTDKVTRGLELASAVAVAQHERLDTVTQEYDALIKDSRQVFEHMRASLQVFHEAFDGEGDAEDGQGEHPDSAKSEEGIVIDGTSDIVDVAMVARRRLRRQVCAFASLSRIPSSIYQLSECLGVLLGIEPVEGRDEMDPDEIIMNYWQNVAIQLKTPTFWKLLMTYEVADQVTEQMVSSLLPICTSPDFDKDLFASVHEVAGILCEWVQTCTAFARDFVLAMPKHAQLLREQETLKQAELHVVKSKMDIYEQTTSSQHASELRDLSELERQQADDRLQDTISLLHLTSAAWKVLSLTREKWQKQFDDYAGLAEHWEGDLLLSTATVAYASSLTYTMRLQLHQLWVESALVHSVVPSPLRRPLYETFQLREIELAKMNLNGLSTSDESVLESAVIALYSYHLPLLIDPYGVASDWLKKHLGSGKLGVASANASTSDAAVWKEIEASIKQEAYLILTDICQDRLHGLHSFLGAKRRALFESINHDMKSGSRSGDGRRCWCYPPEAIVEIADQGDTSLVSGTSRGFSVQIDVPVFEFSSDACKIFMVYTDTNAVPSWMSEYAGELTVVQFEQTAHFVEAQAVQKLFESQGQLRELTEIRTLQQEMIVCDEQICGLEEELLEFLSAEKADQVYSESSKALQIVANRSSVITLKSTKTETMNKVQRHWDSVESNFAVARASLDASGQFVTFPSWFEVVTLPQRIVFPYPWYGNF